MGERKLWLARGESKGGFRLIQDESKTVGSGVREERV